MGFQFTKIQLEATENPNCPQLPSIKGDYFIQGYEVAVKKYKRKITTLEKEKEQLKEQIADIKANCDLAIEGRDVKIMELEQQIEKMKCCGNCSKYDRNNRVCSRTKFSVIETLCNCSDDWELR